MWRGNEKLGYPAIIVQLKVGVSKSYFSNSIPPMLTEGNMVDTRTKEQRHRIMAAVHSKNTSPELLVRRYLWAHGIRYRVCLASLPGKPDIAIPRYKIAIFVHGCFWHGHENCSLGRLPKSRVEYWREKIEKNKIRDRRVIEQLEAEGWNCIVIWHCQLRTKKTAAITLSLLLKKLEGLRRSIDDFRTQGIPRKK